MWKVIGIAIVLSLTWGERGARAEFLCAPRNLVLGFLLAKQGEHITTAAISNSGKMVEITTSKEGTYTLLMTTTEGWTCVLDVGEGWRVFNPHEEGPRT